MNIEKIKKKLGFNSDAGLADYMGITVFTVNNWRKGSKITGPVALLLKYIEKYGRIEK